MANIIFSKNTKNEEKPSFEFTDPKSELREVIKRYDRQTNLIISVLMVSFVIMIFMVATLIIDSSHFNSATYKEYSEKTESFETTQKINQNALNQNEKNQEIIIEQQKQIQDLLKNRNI